MSASGVHQGGTVAAQMRAGRSEQPFIVQLPQSAGRGAVVTALAGGRVVHGVSVHSGAERWSLHLRRQAPTKTKVQGKQKQTCGIPNVISRT